MKKHTNQIDNKRCNDDYNSVFFILRSRDMKKLLGFMAVVFVLSGCSTTYVDVAYKQKGVDCVYSEFAHENKFWGRGDIIEKKISYENTQCSTVIASDLKNALNKSQSLTVVSNKSIGAVAK